MPRLYGNFPVLSPLSPLPPARQARARVHEHAARWAALNCTCMHGVAHLDSHTRIHTHTGHEAAALLLLSTQSPLFSLHEHGTCACMHHVSTTTWLLWPSPLLSSLPATCRRAVHLAICMQHQQHHGGDTCTWQQQASWRHPCTNTTDSALGRRPRALAVGSHGQARARGPARPGWHVREAGSGGGVAAQQRRGRAAAADGSTTSCCDRRCHMGCHAPHACRAAYPLLLLCPPPRPKSSNQCAAIRTHNCYSASSSAPLLLTARAAAARLVQWRW